MFANWIRVCVDFARCPGGRRVPAGERRRLSARRKNLQAPRKFCGRYASSPAALARAARRCLPVPGAAPSAGRHAVCRQRQGHEVMKSLVQELTMKQLTLPATLAVAAALTVAAGCKPANN